MIGAAVNGFGEIKEYVNKHMLLVRYEPKSLKDPIQRCTEFLMVQATLSDYLRLCETELARHTSIVEGLFHDATAAASGGITEKKLAAGSQPDVVSARENKEDLEATIKWTKTYLKIFDNAHVTYRQLSRD